MTGQLVAFVLLGLFALGCFYVWQREGRGNNDSSTRAIFGFMSAMAGTMASVILVGMIATALSKA